MRFPHYINAGDRGARTTYPDTSGARELGANGIYNWLETYGSKYGWVEVSAEEAQTYANNGYPAVTTRVDENGKAGHVQVVCPSKNGNYDEVRGVTVAQAGGHNYEYTHISSVYSSKGLSQVRYYVHA